MRIPTIDRSTILYNQRYQIFNDPFVLVSEDHLLWTGRTTPKGTPMTRTGNNARQYAWEHEHPQGFVLDEDMEILGGCSEDACINPEHSEVFTKGVYRRPIGQGRSTYNPHRQFTTLENTPWDAVVVCSTRVYFVGRFEQDYRALRAAEQWAREHIQNTDDHCHKDRDPATGNLRKNRKK